VHTSLTRHGTAAVRLSAKYTKTDLSDDRFIATAPPYGTEDYFQTGAGAGLSIDTRDSDTVPSRGFRISADGMVFPPVGAVESTFGEVHGEAAYHQPIPVASNPTLALRAGGKQVWGTYPWHEAAYIGGGATVRGFAQQRFAGDSSLYGSAELRVPLARIYLLVPGNLGVYAFGDVGRVFLDGESSSRWHAGAGGGFWLGLIYPGSAASVSIASSEEGTRVYIHAGLAF
jgi:outer membrane protein assembly factor BamA